jgi:hypothetical protein
MPLRLVQVRSCDGKCCDESPRWPKGGTCEFLLDGKCQIQAGNAKVPGESPTWPGRSGEEVFQETCIGWPHNSPEGRDTGGCCWQWVDDGG